MERDEIVAMIKSNLTVSVFVEKLIDERTQVKVTLSWDGFEIDSDFDTTSF